MKYKRKLAFLGLTAAMLIFNNCDQMPAMPSGAGTRTTGSGGLPPGAPGGNPEIVPMSETKTASVISSNRALDSMVSCLGTGTANQRARAEFEKYRGSISLDGAANSVTQPMLTGLAMVGGEVCLDLINKERPLAAAQRRIFNQVNLGGAPNTVDRAVQADVVRRIARSCWGRNESDEELLKIQDNVEAAFAGATGNAATTNKVVYLCAAMVASFAAYDM